MNFCRLTFNLAKALWLVAIPSLLFAQSANSSASTVGTALTLSAPTDSGAIPMYELPVKWNEKGTAVLTVPFKNDSKQVLNILGVQATQGLFVGDFPPVVAPGKEDTLAFFYSAPDNTDGDIDIIRVLTDQGVREIRVKILREAAVKFDSKQLHWAVGAAPEPQSVTVTITGANTMPKAVHSSQGNTATLTFPAPGQYRITVVPGSTAMPLVFPIFVEFDPALPGGAVILSGIIEKK